MRNRTKSWTWQRPFVEGFVPRPVVRLHALDCDAEARIAAFRNPTALSFFSSGKICEKASREAFRFNGQRRPETHCPSTLSIHYLSCRSDALGAFAPKARSPACLHKQLISRMEQSGPRTSWAPPDPQGDFPCAQRSLQQLLSFCFPLPSWLNPLTQRTHPRQVLQPRATACRKAI
jgi:hypothetical protein